MTMEILEIISYRINRLASTIEVKFNLEDDEDGETRIDDIPLFEASDFGYNLITEEADFYSEDDLDDDNNFMDDIVDEDELRAFLNEYYVIYPDRLPAKDYH